MTIDKLIDNTQQLNINEVLRQAASETTEEIKNYQQQQMFFGYGSDGQPIQRLDGKYAVYAPFTEYIKENFRSPKQPTDRVTLRDSGSFYRGIKVTAQQGKVVINSTDEKQPALIRRYGDTILGLNTEYAAIYSQNDLAPLAIDKIRKQILK